jgi:hypothetical protein
MKHDIHEAYLAMAKAGYRPAAPGDGFGSISLTRKQLADPAQLEREAASYDATKLLRMALAQIEGETHDG